MTATRGLLALRDRALAVAQQCTDPRPEGHADRSDVRCVVAVDPSLSMSCVARPCWCWRTITSRSEEVCDLHASELSDVASIFRDAIAVLDTIGWLQTGQTKAMDLVITPSHVAQRQRRRAEMALTLLDRLDGRDRLTEPDEIDEADEAIGADRHAAYGLLRLLRACGRPR